MSALKLHRWLSLGVLALLLIALAAPASAGRRADQGAALAAPVQQGCFDIVVDGGFEQRNWWALGGGLLPASYISSPVVSGLSAVQVGNQVNSASIQAYSTVRQTLTIPVNAVSAQLSFWAWTNTEANPGNDRQEALLLTPGASVLSVSPGAIWSELTNSGGYRQITADVLSQQGRTFDLVFSVYNDGAGGRTWMTVDNVMLVICLSATTPTPTPFPTVTPFSTVTPFPTVTAFPTVTPFPTPATPVPIPPTCVDILANGDFEWNGAWLFGDTAIRPFYAGPPSPVFSGSRSMALGAVLPSSPGNVASFSSIQQAITLPGAAQTARIRFQVFPNSNAAAGGLNRQELVLLDPLNFEQTIDVPWRVTENGNQWQLVERDLTRYLGRTLTIYFNARNAGDGTRTGMYLDQVQMLVCDALAITPFGDTAAASAPQVVGIVAQLPPVAAMPAAQTTVISVGGNPTPLAEVTPGPVVAPTATPQVRSERGSQLSLDLFDNPWVIIIVISALILLSVVAALIFFRGGKEDKPPP